MKSARPYFLICILLATTLQPAFGRNAEDTTKTCRVLPEYRFQKGVVMQTTTTTGTRTGVPRSMTILFSNSSRFMGIVTTDDEDLNLAGSFSVVNLEDSNIVILSEMGGVKKGHCVDMNAAEFKNDFTGKPNVYPKPIAEFTKTGAVKNILGIACSEFQVMDYDGKKSFWIAETRDNWYKPFEGMPSTPGSLSLPAGVKGMILGMTLTSADHTLKTEVEAVKIREVIDLTLSTEGYLIK